MKLVATLTSIVLLFLFSATFAHPEIELEDDSESLGFDGETNEEDGEAEAVQAEPEQPEIKRMVEGIVRKNYAKLHRIQARRTGSTKGSKGPIFCTFQGKIAMRDNCEKFFICQRSGTKPTIGKCKRNKRFHHQMRACLKISYDECRASMCQTTMDKFPDPYNKENYLSCRQMFPAVFACPEGKIFNDDEKTCVEGNAMAGLRHSYEADQNVEKEEDFHVPKTVKPFLLNQKKDNPEEEEDE